MPGSKPFTRRKAPKSLERHLERFVRDALTLKGFYVIKTDAGIASRYARRPTKTDFEIGLPDLVVLHPRKPAFFIEMKAANGKLSERQKLIHNKLRKQGYDVVVLYGEEDVARFLHGLG